MGKLTLFLIVFALGAFAPSAKAQGGCSHPAIPSSYWEKQQARTKRQNVPANTGCKVPAEIQVLAISMLKGGK